MSFLGALRGSPAGVGIGVVGKGVVVGVEGVGVRGLEVKGKGEGGRC